MDENTVKNDLVSIEGNIHLFTGVTERKITSFEESTYSLQKDFLQKADYSVAEIESSIFPYLRWFTVKVSIGITRVTFHSSPEIFALIMAMVSIYRIITFAIHVFNVIKIIGTIWQINQIIMTVWPRYREWFNGMLSKISDVSEYIGWGVDGISHLINASNAGINIVGGLFGKDWNMMRFEMMERANDMAQQLSRSFIQLQEDPGKWLNQFFENRTLLSAYDADKWWAPIAENIADVTNKAGTALSRSQDLFNELLSIQTGMPEVIRANIPQGIWEGIESANNFIHEYIAPTITNIQRNLQTIDNLLNTHGNRLSALADTLAHPGELLLGVDDLPDYAKAAQLGYIDDVTSREFGKWTDMERTELQGDLDEFDRIDRLATAPTPEPAFLTMEIPEGSTLRGITAEHKETWMIGGYNDPR